jgi:hypothetical protein
MAQAICVKGVRIEDPAEVDSKRAEALVHPARYSLMRSSIAWSWPCRHIASVNAKFGASRINLLFCLL